MLSSAQFIAIVLIAITKTCKVMKIDESRFLKLFHQYYKEEYEKN